MKHIKVPIKAYDEALAFCNARLKDKNKKPIKKLPAGLPCDPNSCPCANAVGGIEVYSQTWKWDADSYKDEKQNSPKAFILAFDKGGEEAEGPCYPIRGMK